MLIYKEFLHFKRLSYSIKIVITSILFCLLPITAVASSIMPDIPTTTDIAKMMATLSESLQTIIQLLVATSYVIGFWFITASVNELRIYGQARTMTPLNTSFTGPLARLLCGFVLLFFPGIINISIYSLWGYDSATASMLRFETNGNSQWNAIMDGIRLLTQTFGYISIMRGFISLSRMGKQGGGQPGTFGKGLMHVIGGVMAVNIVATVGVIKSSLGI